MLYKYPLSEDIYEELTLAESKLQNLKARKLKLEAELASVSQGIRDLVGSTNTGQIASIRRRYELARIRDQYRNNPEPAWLVANKVIVDYDIIQKVTPKRITLMRSKDLDTKNFDRSTGYGVTKQKFVRLNVEETLARWMDFKNS